MMRAPTQPHPSRSAATLAFAVAASLTGCGEVPLLEELAPEQSCRRTQLVGPLGAPVAAPAAPEVDWKGPQAAEHRYQLNAWCAAVGPAVVGGWADPPTRPVDSLAIVSWNVHVGGGDLRRLVRELREGVFTGGRPVEHFVLLLQEAYREDDTVPAFDPGLPLGSGVVAAPPAGERRDIVAEAEALGLSILYAPSMRNGEGRGDDDPEDRGNAILATVPLADPLAIELPVARQRRVAVSARVATAPGGGGRPLQVTSVHLENDASGFARDERARLGQTRALLEGLPEGDLAVAGGDFNTWARGPDEALIAAMLREFPETPPFPPGPTYVRGFGLVRRHLDYLFFRLPDGARGRVFRIPDPYASDHFPIVGWVVLPPAAP
ncbi:MAG TPA: endonuclease/exonuclease/phosphatase family protein [Longimicrobiales bacterium]|nr:endonuclease/exonuclease/phosphatase family protein [Longimicrobiales bacterium]